MRLGIILPSLLALLTAVKPAVAQTLYSNGPINGQISAWTINVGFVVSDTFTLNSASTVNGLSFGDWTIADDMLQSVQVEITSSEFGGTTYTDQMINLTQSGCFINGYGYNVCTSSGSFVTGVNLAAGTYWLNLDNACCTLGDPLYWDENSGPSEASENTVGTIPSESFTIFGSSNGTGTVPEPDTLTMFGAGVLVFAGILRRKLF